MSALSQLVNERRAELGITGARELARATQGPAKRLELKPLGNYTVTHVVNGSHGRPTERTLRLLAEALRLPVWRLREAAGTQTGEPEPYRPPAEADRLDRRQRRVVDELIRLLVGSPSLPDGSTTLGPATPPDVAWDEAGAQIADAPPERSCSDTINNADDASSESTDNGAK